MELSVALSLVMFVVFMALILTGYNVAFSFVSTALAFSFIGDLTGTFDPNTLNVLPGRCKTRSRTRPCSLFRCSSSWALSLSDRVSPSDYSMP